MTPTTLQHGSRGVAGGGRARGFTLMEILVVVAIIVLMIAMAVPLFNTLTGARSEESAENQLASILNTARTEAMAMQKLTGVFFYIDLRSNRVMCALVRESDRLEVENDGGTDPQIDSYLDFLEREPVALPPGVGLQVIDNADVDNGGNRRDDGYLGFSETEVVLKNPRGKIIGRRKITPIGGAILFDGRGQLTSRRYGFRMGYQGTDNKVLRSLAGQVLFAPLPSNDPLFDVAGAMYATQESPTGEKDLAPRSHFGVVLFNMEAFRNAAGDRHNIGDPQFDPSIPWAQEAEEERWLDANSIPLVVNRYNGTLIRGEP